MSKHSFATEADLCALFIRALPDGWTAYPETGGFDIVLVRNSDGFQIGVEAKLRLNAKVILQAAEYVGHRHVDQPGPDCRAVLIPSGVSLDLAPLCPLVGVTSIRMRELDLNADGDIQWYGVPRSMARLKSGGYSSPFRPDLPQATSDGPWSLSDGWFELCPVERLSLPNWVPDVEAGHSAPVALTDWKIKAIKIAITLAKRGFVTRRDFAFFKISMSRWTQSGWIKLSSPGAWVADVNMPDFRAQHPLNFSQIEADYEDWKNPTEPARQEALL